MTRDVFLLPSLRVLAAYANFLLALVIEAVFEKLTLTTKITKATKGSNIYTLDFVLFVSLVVNRYFLLG